MFLFSYYAGVDVHRRSISFCVKRADGTVVKGGKIVATHEAIAEWARTLDGTWCCGWEATICSHWIYEQLKQYATQVRMANLGKLKASRRLSARTRPWMHAHLPTCCAAICFRLAMCLRWSTNRCTAIYGNVPPVCRQSVATSSLEYILFQDQTCRVISNHQCHRHPRRQLVAGRSYSCQILSGARDREQSFRKTPGKRPRGSQGFPRRQCAEAQRALHQADRPD
jgi:hypothetical protein